MNMEKLGLVINLKKLLQYWILLMVGIAFIFIGIIGYYENQNAIKSKMSDTEIIERAKALGMVDAKTEIMNNSDAEGNKDDTSK